MTQEQPSSQALFRVWPNLAKTSNRHKKISSICLLFPSDPHCLSEQDFLQEHGLSWFLNGHVSGRLLKSLPPCPKIPPHSRNGVFATFLYAEFLKELAAIAQEHSIRPDLLMDE